MQTKNHLNCHAESNKKSILYEMSLYNIFKGVAFSKTLFSPRYNWNTAKLALNTLINHSELIRQYWNVTFFLRCGVQPLPVKNVDALDLLGYSTMKSSYFFFFRKLFKMPRMLKQLRWKSGMIDVVWIKKMWNHFKNISR
jgi:hypothetical protein